jgi:hypothetical protein
VEWEFGSWKCKGEESLRSLLFTLKNLRDVPARKFALRVKEKQYAIYCDSECDP